MMDTPKLDALMTIVRSQFVTRYEFEEQLRKRTILFDTHGPALVAVLKDVLHQWHNRGEETSIHVWNERVKESVVKAEQLLTQLEQEAG